MSKKILCFGDSNTYGYDPRTGLRYPKNVRWTGILAGLLGEDFEVIEEGCNGRTTVFEEPGAPWKAGNSSVQAVVNSHKPVDLVILMLGSNDLKAIYHAETPSIAAGAECLVQMIQNLTRQKQAQEAKILLVSPIRVGQGMLYDSPFALKNSGSFDGTAITRSEQFKWYYRNIAERYGCLFVDAAEIASPSLVDSLHMDPEDHRKLAEAFASVIKKYFGVPESAAAREDTGTAMLRFQKVIARLRDPEKGCPWDRAQTLASLKPCCVEETAEVLAGIDRYTDTGDAGNLKEELGDLLMQVVLQSQIAEEEGLFDLTDVIRVITEKMIRRHPHVFHVNDPENGDLEEMIRANQAVDADGNLLTDWNEIKALEKRGKDDTDRYKPQAFSEVCDLIDTARKRMEENSLRKNISKKQSYD